MTSDERWLAANWPFVRAWLPAAPARGLQKMVEDNKYCIDILPRVSAVARVLTWCPAASGG